MRKIPVSILGATGTVGQRFVQLLDGHPWFEVVTLTGSDRSVGMKYAEACHWVLSAPMPEWARGMTIVETDPKTVQTPIAFSALPAKTAWEAEAQLAQSGVLVCSNASAYRMQPDVPILLPEVNADHIAILEHQRKRREWSGGIITNSNCTCTGMTIALKALHDAFGVEKVFAVSMQAISGAGYPGVASLDICDNILPYIAGEDEKVEQEPLKILGSLNGSEIKFAPLVISAQTNRVPVTEGHTVCLNVKLNSKASAEVAKQVMSAYRPPEVCRDLPFTPKPVIRVLEEVDRPQPRLDRDFGNGMVTTVGKVRSDPIFDLKFVVLSHNTVRGAAGGSIYNAELAVAQGYV
ncbi:MAG: aspartate-semialdehyde dehydrogenase [Anaerolineales bacterium]|nr:aspartate-semialdehyde dehydrogenase [Anaerolineales bacterium]MCS7246737.1 aspartate-semialdehyde dehydrogenase [Anaerolineales bacterium]MDW8160547.1 aspartate-semialdehyde dehydrogenase [Anaerolineales bacterium]MDW8447340.1 aspartate-semialdehyde dehydrogenase [Anaerolineales bacterium]